MSRIQKVKVTFETVPGGGEFQGVTGPVNVDKMPRWILYFKEVFKKNKWLAFLVDFVFFEKRG